MKSTSTENPFAVPARKPALFRSLKTLAVIVFCLAAVLTVQFGSKYWLLRQLTSDWDSQSVTVRVERLGSLAELGDLGRPMLVRTLTDPHRRVARAAYEHLLDQQAEWVMLADDRADENYRDLVDRLAEVSPDVPDDRRGWMATLLNTVITETVEHSSADAALAYSGATKLLADRRSKTALSGGGEAASDRVALRTDPLPVELLMEVGGDDDEDELSDPAGGRDSPDDSRSSDLQAAPSVAPDELRPLSETDEAAVDAEDASSADAERVVVPVQHLTDAPFETYATRSVIAWLRSVQPKLRDIARNELVRRGFDESELELAARMADPDIRVRLGLLNELSDRGDLDPRPWLLWMAEDAERDVRLRALTSLATMQDPNIREKLRERLPHESDPAVISLLRRVLSRH